jgi:hypothetical protein
MPKQATRPVRLTDAAHDGLMSLASKMQSPAGGNTTLSGAVLYLLARYAADVPARKDSA